MNMKRKGLKILSLNSLQNSTKTCIHFLGDIIF